MNYPKVYGDHNPAAQAVGESRVRQLKQIDAPYLSASGPGFTARKRGVFSEVVLSDGGHEDKREPRRLLTFTSAGQTWLRDNFAPTVKDASTTSTKKPNAPIAYLGRGIFLQHIFKPEMEYRDANYYQTVFGEAKGRRQGYITATKPGYFNLFKAVVSDGATRFSTSGLKNYIPTCVDFYKRGSYHQEYFSKRTQFPGYPSGFTIIGYARGYIAPGNFAGFFKNSEGQEKFAIVNIGATMASSSHGGYESPTTHDILEIWICGTSLNSEDYEFYQVEIPPGEGGVAVSLHCARPVTISPGVVMLYLCEPFEVRYVYDKKCQGDLYVAILDIAQMRWVLPTKKLPLAFPRIYISTEDASGSSYPVVEPPNGLRIPPSPSGTSSDVVELHTRFNSLMGAEFVVCCNSNCVIAVHVAVRGVNSAPPGVNVIETGYYLQFHKINYDGNYSSNNLFIGVLTPTTPIGGGGPTSIDEEKILTSYADQQLLRILCVGRGKFLLVVRRFSAVVNPVGGSFSYPPEAKYMQYNYILSEDDGDTWEQIIPSGLPASEVGYTAEDYGLPCVVNGLSDKDYLSGKAVELIMPAIDKDGGATAYYKSSDCGRTWGMVYGRGTRNNSKYWDLNSSGLVANATGVAQSVVVYGFNLPAVGDKYDVINPRSSYGVEDVDSAATTYAYDVITQDRVSRILNKDNSFAPYDVLRPWLYDDKYKKPEDE